MILSKIMPDFVTDSANVLMEEACALHACAERLLTASSAARRGYEQAIELMLQTLRQNGKIIVTGVGKSGKISEKIVATMLSTGTPATFLHPVEAMHGDLGVVDDKDVVLALSFSGNTEELMRIVPSLNHRGVPIIGLGGNDKSQLAKCSAAWIDGFVAQEASDIPAPTSSTTLALALGDAIALTLAKYRSFTRNDFALNHPGGSLGRRLLLKIKDCMIPASKVATVTESASLDRVILEMTRHPKGGGVIVLRQDNTTAAEAADVAGQQPIDGLLTPPSSSASSEQGSASAIVVNDDEENLTGRVVGVITHENIHRILKTAARETIFDITASNIMTRNPVVCSVEDLATDAMNTMVPKDSSKDTELPLLPVVDENRIWRGVVTLKDLQELF